MIKIAGLVASGVTWYMLVHAIEQWYENKKNVKSVLRLGALAMMLRLVSKKDFSGIIVLMVSLLPLAFVVLHGRDIAENLSLNKINISLAVMVIIVDFDLYLSQALKKVSFSKISHVYSSNLIMILTLICVSYDYGVIDVYTLTQQQTDYTWGIIKQPFLSVIFISVIIKKMYMERGFNVSINSELFSRTIKKMIYSYLIVMLFVGGSANVFPILSFQEKHEGILPFFEWLSLTMKVGLTSALLIYAEKRYALKTGQSVKQMLNVLMGAMLLVFLIRLSWSRFW